MTALGNADTGGRQYARLRQVARKHPARIELEVMNGVVLVGSDAHYWPNLPRSTAHSAFVRLAREMRPAVVIQNGDVIDAPTASTHASIGWESRPPLVEEIAVAQERLAELYNSAWSRHKEEGPRTIWTLGNHDMRFETYLARVAPMYAGIDGIHLKDHFPNWEPAWSVWINNELVIKHRWHNGVHAVRNNTLKSGLSMVTGHLHSLKCVPFTDYRGTRYGVDTGTLAIPYGPQFVNYTEDNPVDWRSGLAAFTFIDGLMLPPELLTVIDEEARITAFRGVLHMED